MRQTWEQGKNYPLGKPLTEPFSLALGIALASQEALKLPAYVEQARKKGDERYDKKQRTIYEYQ